MLEVMHANLRQVRGAPRSQPAAVQHPCYGFPLIGEDVNWILTPHPVNHRFRDRIEHNQAVIPVLNVAPRNDENRRIELLIGPVWDAMIFCFWFIFGWDP